MGLFQISPNPTPRGKEGWGGGGLNTGVTINETLHGLSFSGLKIIGRIFCIQYPNCILLCSTIIFFLPVDQFGYGKFDKLPRYVSISLIRSQKTYSAYNNNNGRSRVSPIRQLWFSIFMY